MTKVIKLTSGELIVGELVRNPHNNTAKVEKPRFLVPTERGLAFTDFVGMFSEEDELELNESAITFLMNPAKETLSLYKQHISGIITPSTSLKI